MLIITEYVHIFLYCAGIIFYQMAFGVSPYEIQNETDFGFRCISRNNIKKLLTKLNLVQYVNNKMISLLNYMLNTDENTRFNTSQVLNHAYFAAYYKKYYDRVFSQK